MKTRFLPLPRRHGGFTLIELMVTIAIALILAMIAVPSFVSFQRNSEITSTANSLLSSLNAARGEGMKRNLPSAVQAIGGLWKNGWMVFVDVTHDGSNKGAYNYAAGNQNNDILISQHDPLPSYFTIASNGTATEGNTPTYMSFDGSGFAVPIAGSPNSNLTVSISRNDLTGAEALAQTRRIIITNSGRARVCTPQSDTDSNCPAP